MGLAVIETLLVLAGLRRGIAAEHMLLKRGELRKLERLEGEGLSTRKLLEECRSAKHI